MCLSVFDIHTQLRVFILIKKASSLFVLLGLSFASSQVYANTQTLSDEEARLSVCTMVSQGSLTVATARQKEMTQAQTKAVIDETLVLLKQKLRHGFVDYIAQVWYADIERMYQMPVLNTPEEKAVFAQIMEELSHSECMGKQPNLDL